MKKLLAKADEMEMSVNDKAARNAYVFLEAALAIYCIADFLKSGELSWVWLILIASLIVFFGTKLIETKRLTASGDSDEE